MPAHTGAQGRAGLITVLTVLGLMLSASAAQAIPVPEQNTGFGSSIPEGVCMTAAEDYYTAVAAVSAVADVGAPGG